MRLIDCCITQLKAQGPFRTCNESKEEEEEAPLRRVFQPLYLRGIASSDLRLVDFRITQKFAVVPRRARILRLMHCCITQLKAQGPSRTCNESKEEEEAPLGRVLQPLYLWARILRLIDSCITQL